MADQIQIQITYADTIGDNENQVRGYVDAVEVRGLRRILENATFIELKDENGNPKAWINRNHAAKIRVVDGIKDKGEHVYYA